MSGGAGHTIVSFDSVLKGLGKLKLDETAIRGDLNNHWEVQPPPLRCVACAVAAAATPAVAAAATPAAAAPYAGSVLMVGRG